MSLIKVFAVAGLLALVMWATFLTVRLSRLEEDMEYTSYRIRKRLNEGFSKYVVNSADENWHCLLPDGPGNIATVPAAVDSAGYLRLFNSVGQYVAVGIDCIPERLMKPECEHGRCTPVAVPATMSNNHDSEGQRVVRDTPHRRDRVSEHANKEGDVQTEALPARR